MAPRPEYIEITCKSAIHRVYGMPYLKWSLNPYGGCVHRCRFCFAVQYRVLADQGTQQDFGTRLFIKTNFLEVLHKELSKKAMHGEHISVGTSTDPYQPVEGRYKLTRGSLTLLRDYANPMSLLTKSPMVVRDIDLLRDLEAEIYFSITTVDLDLWPILEPGTANPFQRLRAMQRLRQAGVRAGVMMAPILPGLTDSVPSIEAVARAAREHDASYLHTAPLRLQQHVKEFYLDFIEDQYPELLARYRRAYPGVHAPPEYRDKLQQRVQRVLTQYDFDAKEVRQPIEKTATRLGPQWALPI